MKKIYSAFISSESSLDSRRKEVINTLLNARILPIGMEHFTVGKFSEIEQLIDDSDLFLLLMGAHYGTVDKETGISITRREYEYARAKQKPILVIVFDKNKPWDEGQAAFLQKINDDNIYVRELRRGLNVENIISQYLHSIDFSQCIGWTRLEKLSPEVWQKENRALDISGKWYSIHLNEKNKDYIRVGTVTFRQTFTEEAYKRFTANGINHNISYYDRQNDTLQLIETKKTEFNGTYFLEENGKIFGFYNSERKFEDGTFGGQSVEAGKGQGRHEFLIDTTDRQQETIRIEGDFRDEVPQIKHGQIYLFRVEADRNAFLLTYRGDFIQQR